MDPKELLDRLTTGREWAQANEYEAPICLQDDLTAAITMISTLTTQVEQLQAENAHLRKMQPVAVDGDTAAMALELAQVRAELERVKREREAAVAAVDRMAEYIVVFGLVDQFLCDDIPRELHLKYQPKDDGDYENGPCIECVKEYYLRGPQKEE